VTILHAGTAVTACRLLAASPDGVADLGAHLARFGDLPVDDYPGGPGRRILVEQVARAGLRGRGGAGFPLAEKLLAVGGARKPCIVVANGCEGDPTSAKDRTLLRRAPHLVLDGIALAAYAIGAREAVLAVHEGSPLIESVTKAAAVRDDTVPVTVAQVPARFVASESSALVASLSGEQARPTGVRTSERGVRGRPTLVSNVETLAHLALVARFGDGWFRTQGTAESPGTALVTVSGAVNRPSVHEVPYGLPVSDALELAGGEIGPLQAVLVGGLGGTWLSIADAAELPLAHETGLDRGVPLGVASLVALPAGACGIAETARILDHLAAESAGQCGPCLFGLPAIADDLELLALGHGDAELLPRLERRLGVVPGRGACGHPDGAVRTAASALHAFADDAIQHARGKPCRGMRRRFVPVDAR
jgi:NADH:ubiquinone oxidoreductase subunit F (NADH-binding)